MTHERLLQICEGLMGWIVGGSFDDTYVKSYYTSSDYETFNKSCNISNEELKELGFGYLVDIKEV